MTHVQVKSVIEDILRRIIAERGGAPVTMTGDTALLGGTVPIDSLDLATLVVELEGHFGIDPFKEGFIEFRTLDELAALYATG
jgi:acyl carrier protein